MRILARNVSKRLRTLGYNPLAYPAIQGLWVKQRDTHSVTVTIAREFPNREILMEYAEDIIASLENLGYTVELAGVDEDVIAKIWVTKEES